MDDTVGSQNKEAPKEERAKFNGKEMIARNNKKKTKFFRGDRMKVRITKTMFRTDGTVRMKIGRILKPQRLMAEQMILDGFAEQVKE